MSTSFFLDERLVIEARVAAAHMGKNLDQMLNTYLETVVHQQKAGSSFAEFAAISGQVKEHTWNFNRDELHERT